jgi:hypothetical protein
MARQQAHQILSNPPYISPKNSTPRPFAGILHAIGRGLEIAFGPMARWVSHHLFAAIGSGFTHVFGGWAPVIGIGLTVALGVALAFLLVHRRSRIAARSEGQAMVNPTLDPADLEAQAERLAVGGDYAGSFRLRFEAGLMRLESIGLIAGQRTRTDADLTDHIGSAAFDRLARRHEAITFAAQPASERDDIQARTDWPQVPQQAREHRVQVRSGAP